MKTLIFTCLLLTGCAAKVIAFDNEARTVDIVASGSGLRGAQAEADKFCGSSASLLSGGLMSYGSTSRLYGNTAYHSPNVHRVFRFKCN